MKALNFFFALFIIFFLAGCSETKDSTPVSPLDNSTTLSKVNPVPFHFTFDAISNTTLTSSFSGSALMEGRGNATHVGKYTSISKNDIIYTSATTGNILNGTHTTFTANGEEMHATYAGTFIIKNGLGINTINFIFNGGTGRFENLYGEIHGVITTEDSGQLTQNLSGSGSGYIIY